ncbi:topology modulation protein [Pseudovibrio axinellae]|uniref:Topology modulation protein n=1 Tax=Pseudovibrio axinellae TaxID=989403 RepID=A0A166A3X3_9HYPH|nr:adenylate kinase [Pseudovibrio axinellae]KZL20598.1 topology modulation protein [Pseudovibrio axinellae]SER28263.1 Adenylate kinase [Pseudovibrio axinellae]
MQRVMVVGCPGLGKSTLARELAAATGLPLVHLDFHYWQAGWVPTDKSVWAEKVKELAADPCWIIDGNYGGTLEYRVARADTVILLDFPTHICFFRALRRMLMGFTKKREGEFVDGCEERFDWKFLWFVLNYKRARRSRDLDKLAQFDGQILRFEHPKELERLWRLVG